MTRLTLAALFLTACGSRTPSANSNDTDSKNASNSSDSNVAGASNAAQDGGVSGDASGSASSGSTGGSGNGMGGSGNNAGGSANSDGGSASASAATGIGPIDVGAMTNAGAQSGSSVEPAVADTPPAGAKNYYYVTSDKNEATPAGYNTLSISGFNTTKFAAGDVVKFLGGGTYTNRFCFVGVGTSANPVSVTTYGNDVARLVTTTKSADCSGWQGQYGASDSGWTGGVTIENSTYVNISNLDVESDGSVTDGIAMFSTTYVNLTNVAARHFSNTGISDDDYGVLTNVSADYNSYLGIALFGAHQTINGCETSYNGDSSSAGGNIFIAAGASYDLVQGCDVSHSIGSTVDGDGIDFDWSSSHSIAQYNYVHDNDGAGLMVCDADGTHPDDDITIRYNLVVNNGRANGYGGIDINDYLAPGHGSRAKGSTVKSNFYIYGNTIYADDTSVRSGTPAAVRVWLNRSPNSDGLYTVVFANNVLVTKDASENLLWAEGVGTNTVTFTRDALWSIGGSSDYEIHDFTDANDINLTALGMTPGFANVATPESTSSYKIAMASSPLVGAGLAMPTLKAAMGDDWTMGLAPSEDYAGTSLNAAKGLDIGAYAFGGSGASM